MEVQFGKYLINYCKDGDSDDDDNDNDFLIKFHRNYECYVIDDMAQFVVSR